MRLIRFILLAISLTACILLCSCSSGNSATKDEATTSTFISDSTSAKEEINSASSQIEQSTVMATDSADSDKKENISGSSESKNKNDNSTNSKAEEKSNSSSKSNATDSAEQKTVPNINYNSEDNAEIDINDLH